VTQSERARAAELQADYRQLFADLRLIEHEECARFGRYYLRGNRTWAEVVTIRGGVVVCGDVDTVCFQWFSDRGNNQTVRGPLYWMAYAGYSYAEEKASIGMTDGYGTCVTRVFDVDVARYNVLDQRRHGGLTREQASEIWGFLKNNDEVDKVTFADAVFGATGDYDLCTIGDVTAHRVFAAQAVLRCLVEALEAIDARGFRKRSLGWFWKACAAQ